MQQDKKQQIPVLYLKQNQWKQAIYGQCLYLYIGNRVDLQWNRFKKLMKLSPSILHQTTYYHNEKQGIQIIKGAKFDHRSNCTFPKTVTNKKKKFIKPCACVLIFNQQSQQILITQRSQKLRTYPSAWVLPGGHLQKNETIFEGGIRQCNQQVGFPKNISEIQPIQPMDIWVFEAVCVIDGQIRSSAIIVYFRVNSQKFQPLINPAEVAQCKWKNIDDNSEEKLYDGHMKTGYPEGHLKYMQHIRQQRKRDKN